MRRASVGDTALLLQASDVRVRRGRATVLEAVDVTLRRGEAVHLRGANGSGKSSLLRVLAGLLIPAAGSVRGAPSRAFVPERVALTPSMRCGEWLAAMRALRGEAALDWADPIRASGLQPDVLRRPTGDVSKGMLQRVALAEALHSGAQVLLLDEPFSGLDATATEWLVAGLRAHAEEGRAAIMTDHRATAVHRVATRSITLNAGRATRTPGDEAAERIVRAEHAELGKLSRRVHREELGALLVALVNAGWDIEEVTACGPLSGTSP